MEKNDFKEQLKYEARKDIENKNEESIENIEEMQRKIKEYQEIIEQKRKDVIISKLKYIQNEPTIDKRTYLSEKEWNTLFEYLLTQEENCDYAKIQDVMDSENDEYYYTTIMKLGDKYVFARTFYSVNHVVDESALYSFSVENELNINYYDGEMYVCGYDFELNGKLVRGEGTEFTESFDIDNFKRYLEVKSEKEIA